MVKIVVKFLFILIVLFSGTALADQKESSLLVSFYNFFPKVTEMEGGSSRWLTTDIAEETHSGFVTLKRTYSSFNKNPEKIWDIQRKKSFKVEMTILYAKNFIIAESLYKEKVSRKVKFRKGIGFGDMGTMLIAPVPEKYPDAFYELIFIDKTFVVSLKSTDGFALMDFADYIETSISSYILNNFDRFFIKKLSITASSTNYRIQTEDLAFVEEDLKELVIEGRVLDINNNIIPFIDVELKDFKLSTTTDEDGYYKFILPFKGKNSVELVQNFILKPNLHIENSRDINIYDIKINYKMNTLKEENLHLKMMGDEETLFGLLLETNGELKKVLKFREEAGKIHFVRDCSRAGSSFRCIQIFDGIKSKNDISGSWKGTGGGGSWSGVLLDDSFIKVSEISNKTCVLSQVSLGSDGTILEESDQLNISYGNETTNSFIRARCNFAGLNNFYTERISLVFTHLTSVTEDNIDLFMFNVSLKENKYKFVQSEKVATLLQEDEPYSVKIDITGLAKGGNSVEFLLGMPLHTPRKGSHEFAGLINYSLIRPRIELSTFVNKSNTESFYSGEIVSFKSTKDFASNNSTARPDGKSDIHLRISNFEKSGTISFLEIRNTGNMHFKWNTNIFDLFPENIVMKDNKIFKNIRGIFRVAIEKGDSIDIFLFRPEELDKSNVKLSYRLKLGNEWITGNIK